MVDIFHLYIARPVCYHAIVIVSFRTSGAEDIFNGRNTRDARQTCPQQLWRVAFRKLDMLDKVENLEDLNEPPGNQLEALHGDREAQHSIRINRQYRICFVWVTTGPSQVEIVDYH